MNRTFVKYVRLVLLAAGLLCFPDLTFAGPSGDGGFVPSFFDPAHRLPRPDPGAIKQIRFLTEDDYPPFHFLAPDGTLTGFDIEIARAVCEELKIACTIQPRRFETLIDALVSGQGDAVIAGLVKTRDNSAKLEFSTPYYRTPARFAASQAVPAAGITPAGLAGKVIGVRQGTAHEAYLRAFFSKSAIQPYDTRDSLRAALRRGDVGLIFDDGISLSFWLNGADAGHCCSFAGGAFTESAYFGEGVAIALRKDDAVLRRAIDYGLQKITEKGLFADIYLKYFPVGFY